MHSSIITPLLEEKYYKLAHPSHQLPSTCCSKVSAGHICLPHLRCRWTIETCSVTICINQTCISTAFIVHWRRSSLNNTQHIECVKGVSLVYINRHWHWRQLGRGECMTAKDIIVVMLRVFSRSTFCRVDVWIFRSHSQRFSCSCKAASLITRIVRFTRCCRRGRTANATRPMWRFVIAHQHVFQLASEQSMFHVSYWG